MTEKQPPLNNTYTLIGQIAWAVMNELKTLSGKEANPVKFSDLKTYMIENLQDYPFGKDEFALKLSKSGELKWLRELPWAGTLLKKLEYKTGKTGYWELTPEGDVFLNKHQGKQNEAEEWLGRKYAEIFDARPEKTKPSNEEASTSIPGESSQKSFDEDEISNEISAHIENLDPYEFQKLVGHLFEGMGYTVSYVSTPGPDGGIDLIAHEDPLGINFKTLKIQVKHSSNTKQGQKPGLPAIQQLNGICSSDNSVGVFVTSTEFPSSVEKQVRLDETLNVRLIDNSRFIELWQQHYETIPQAGKAMLPLKGIYVLDTEEAPEVPEDDDSE